MQIWNWIRNLFFHPQPEKISCVIKGKTLWGVIDLTEEEKLRVEKHSAVEILGSPDGLDPRWRKDNIMRCYLEWEIFEKDDDNEEENFSD